MRVSSHIVHKFATSLLHPSPVAVSSPNRFMPAASQTLMTTSLTALTSAGVAPPLTAPLRWPFSCGLTCTRFSYFQTVRVYVKYVCRVIAFLRLVGSMPRSERTKSLSARARPCCSACTHIGVSLSVPNLVSPSGPFVPLFSLISCHRQCQISPGHGSRLEMELSRTCQPSVGRVVMLPVRPAAAEV